MNGLTESFLSGFAGHELSVRLTAMLLHFLWQGAAIGVVTAATVWLFRNRSAQLRYVTYLTGLALMATASLVTFAMTDSASALSSDTNAPDGDSSVSRVTPIGETGLDSSVRPAAGDGEQTSPAVTTGLQTPTGQQSAFDPAVADSVAIEPPETGAARNTGSRASVASDLNTDVESFWFSGFDAGLIAPYASVTYLMGLLVMLAKFAHGVWCSRRWVRLAVPVEDSMIMAVFDESVKTLGLRFRPVLAWSEEAAVPVVCGVLRPVILLPVYLMTGLEAGQLHALLCHELSHIRRLDPLVNLLQRVVETLLFFHPVVWWVSRRVSAERENCCDDSVVTAGADPVAYAATLLRVSELFVATQRGASGTAYTVAMTGGQKPSEMKRRILRLVEAPVERRLQPGQTGGLMVLLCVTLALVVGLLQANAQQPDGRSDPSDLEAPATAVPDGDDEPRAAENRDAARAARERRLEEVRGKGQAAFRAGDYEQMIAVYRGLAESDDGTLDDVLWMAHGYHLNEQWTEAGAAFQQAIRQFDRDDQKFEQEIRQIDRDLKSGRTNDDGFSRGGPGLEGRKRYLEHQQESLHTRWPQLILMTGLLERDQLHDAQAAIATLKQGTRFCPTVARDLNELALDAQYALAGKKLKPTHRSPSEPLYSVATVRELAITYDAVGETAAALDCWCRVRLCSLCYRIAHAYVEREHLLSLLSRVSADEQQDYHRVVEANPGDYAERVQREMVWDPVPADRRSPFTATMLPELRLISFGPGHGSMVRMKDGRFLLAGVGGDWRQSRIVLSSSADGTTWDAGWEFAHNSIFKMRAPSLAIDDDGTIWMLFLSKRLDLNRSSSSPYRLWLTSSRDGKQWDKLRPVAPDRTSQYQHSAHLTRDHAGRFWIFHNGSYAGGETPDDLGEWHQLPFELENEPGGPDHMHATFDPNGICHLVFDTFGFAIHYTRSSDMRTWSKPVTIERKREGSNVELPQLIIRSGQAILLNETTKGLWGRPVDLDAELGPVFGEPRHLVDHRVCVNGGRALIDRNTVYLPSGRGYTPAMLTVPADKLFAAVRPQTADQARAERVPIRELAEGFAAATSAWELHEVSEQPDVVAGGHRGYRIVLRTTWKHYTNPVQQVESADPDPGPFELRHNDLEFVVFPTSDKKLPADLRSRIPWRKSNSSWHTRDVWIGEGDGYAWFTRSTIHMQDYVRASQHLKGGDDRLQLLTDGLSVVDDNGSTSNYVSVSNLPLW